MKTVRPVAIADHLWDTLGRMAEGMGSGREALLNEALYLYARLHGFAPAERPPPLRSPERQAVADRVLEVAARLERALPAKPGLPARASGRLVLVRDDGKEIEVAGDRFVVGRGRHCDLVIDSGKVSREHAAFVREAGAWIVEDLGSANGTWHRKARVGRHALADGDEIFVCAEKITCLLP